MAFMNLFETGSNAFVFPCPADKLNSNVAEVLCLLFCLSRVGI